MSMETPEGHLPIVAEAQVLLEAAGDTDTGPQFLDRLGILIDKVITISAQAEPESDVKPGETTERLSNGGNNLSPRLEIVCEGEESFILEFFAYLPRDARYKPSIIANYYKRQGNEDIRLRQEYVSAKYLDENDPHHNAAALRRIEEAMVLYEQALGTRLQAG